MARYQRSYGQVIIKRKTPFGIVYTKSFSDTISIIETFFTGKELVNTPLYSDANIIQYNQFENLTAAIGTNLTNNGSVVFDAGKFNNGADFGASNTTKYLSIPISISAPSGAATFSMWVQILTQPATNASYNLMTCRTTGGGTNYVDWQIIYKDVSGTKQLYFDRSRPGVGDQGPTYNVDLGTTGFHLITFTYDGTNIHGYVDGIDQTGATAASGVGTGGTNALFLGSTNSSTGFASAKLDDFAIFSRTLTATEVKSLFTGSFGTSYTKTFTETYTLIESFIKATNKQLVDTFALVEFFIKRSSKQFNDTFAISEVYQTLRTRTVSFVDSLTILDTLTKQTQKLLVDTFTLTDSIVKQTQKVFSEVFTLIENFLAVKNGGTHNYTQTFSESIVIVEIF
jgi:archaellum component FlaF (FlaF/FlaG flagellin family)